jgi:diguanylate cyclase (GGDEF)-like protein/PAS domain S-box-containing protein
MRAHRRQLQFILFGGLALFLVSMLALSAYSLWRLRAEAIADGLQVAALHARSQENFLTHSLGVAEQIAATMAGVDASPAQRARQQEALAGSLRNTPFLRSLSLQDGTGRIVLSSNPANVGITVQSANFLPQAPPGQNIFRIGPAWMGRDFAQGRASTQEQPVPVDSQSFFPATRNLTTARGNWTVLMAFNSDYFVNQMAQAMDSGKGQVEVLHYDGSLLMGTALDANPGASRAQEIAAMHLSATESGALEQATGHGAASLTAFRASHQYPLVVVVHLNRAQALQAWQTDAKTLVAVLLPTLLGMVLLATVFYRRQLDALQQRAEADRVLRINATVFDASSEAIILTDPQANIISVNQAFTQITGWDEAEVRGHNPRVLASGMQEKAFFIQLWQELLRSGVWRGEVTNRRKDGSVFVAWLSISVSRDAQGLPQHYIGLLTDITERRQVESKVLELNRDFVSFLDNSRDFVYFKDRDSRFRFASQTLANITGHAHWRDMIGKHDLEVFPPETAKIYHEEELPIFQRGEPLLNKVDPYVDADGKQGWVSTSKWPLLDVLGRVEGLFGISRDITELKRTEEKLQLAASVFHNSREGIAITGTDGTIVDVNEAFSDITGYSREEVIGQNPRILSSGRHNQEHYADMWQALIHKGHWYGEIWNRRKSGEVYPEMLTITTVRDTQGQAQNYVALFSDITTAKVHEEHLEHIAHYDALTSLPNRVLLADRLKQAMLQVQRRAQRLAVVYLDLDGFKNINDMHGHEAGDHLLVNVAIRMKSALREGDTLARIGGDEFVAVLVDLADATESMPMLNRLLLAASELVAFEGQQLQVSASLGVTLYPQEEEIDADQLQRQADQAMYQAKVSGKNCFHFFDSTHDRHVREHHESLARVRSAIRAGEFVLHYQPKVHMRSGRIVGAEALIRWQHPERGMLAPGLFLPVIEDNVLSVELDEWVLGAALDQMQAWQDAGVHMPVSINIGARLLQQHDFVQRLRNILLAHPGVKPAQVQLEVLETSALEDIARVSHTMNECRRLGVGFALDDFGTGYSSLTYVKRLPVSQIKIDKSFVRDMLTDKDDMAILRAVTGLATSFGLEVIAEGVETREQGVALMALGCELAQGYFIARAMPALEFVDWAGAWQCDPSWTRPQSGSEGNAD